MMAITSFSIPKAIRRSNPHGELSTPSTLIRANCVENLLRGNSGTGIQTGITNTGGEHGGPVVTAGGLLFIGATNHDRKFHVFDKITGELLWETTLPASGNATPAVYEVKGKQFVVIAAGGGKSGAASGGCARRVFIT